MRWHKANERYLMNRSPIATVGVVWSQRNTDFHGRDRADELVDLPQRGFTQALIRARIPYLPVHVDDIDRADGLSVLILPNVAAMSDEQCAAVRRFVNRGGGLIATGASSLENEWGDPRPDFALADLFKTHAGKTFASDCRRWAGQSAHTYLRLTPEMRARVYGPKAGNEPLPTGERHPILYGFDETDILPYGGMLAELQVDSGAVVPMTFIPAFPVYPPETAWMRQPKTGIAGAILNARPNGARIAYLPADIDRRYARDHLPDHGNLLANIVLWTAKNDIPLKVEGPGLIDCHVYQQPGRVILHLVNLTSAGTWRAPMDELISVGPFQVSVRIPDTIQGRALKLLVSQGTARMDRSQSWATFEVKSILDHEVAVIE